MNINKKVWLNVYFLIMIELCGISCILIFKAVKIRKLYKFSHMDDMQCFLVSTK
jgi:hypothetical protein